MPAPALPMTTFDEKNYIPEVLKKNTVDNLQYLDAWLNCKNGRAKMVSNKQTFPLLQTTFWYWFCLSLASVSTCTSILFSQLFPFILLFLCGNGKNVKPKLFGLQGMSYMSSS